MSKINYIKGNLFDVTKTAKQGKRAILAHSCNCFGVWGGGIAYQFKLKYPAAYEKYHDYCLANDPRELIGKSFIIREPNIDIACLFTSLDGSDSAVEIVNYTRSAIQHMANQYGEEDIEINMPKINSGIFGVDWSMTEKVLVESGLHYNVYVI